MLTVFKIQGTNILSNFHSDNWFHVKTFNNYRTKVSPGINMGTLENTWFYVMNFIILSYKIRYIWSDILYVRKSTLF